MKKVNQSEARPSSMDYFTYTGDKTKEISFPLGGIGTGCIGLAGNGKLIDWEIYNRPNKGTINGFSHFAIKAESNGKVLDARVLNGDLLPGYTGELNGPQWILWFWATVRAVSDRRYPTSEILSFMGSSRWQQFVSGTLTFPVKLP